MIAQVLHDIEEWEDIPVETHCMMGDKKYLMKVCRDRVEYEMQAEDARRRREAELERNEHLQDLIEQVNEQARMVGELQTQNQQLNLQGASGTRKPGICSQDSQQSSYSHRCIWNSSHKFTRLF